MWGIFNDFYMTAVSKKIKYTLKILLKCMNLFTNLKTTKSLCLVFIYIYEILFNCNKIVVAWNWSFVIFILFSRFQGIFSHVLFTLDGKMIFATGRRGVEVRIKSLNCANVRNRLRQETRQRKNRSVRF